MEEQVISKIPALSIGEVIDTLSKFYSHAVKSEMLFKNVPGVFLWGAPGIGKSQAVHQIAKSVSKETGKKVNVTDIRLLLYSPVDLKGVPFADQSRTHTEWLLPKVFDLRDDDNLINILFLDELNAATPAMQACAYQIVLDRKIGEHRLPENTLIIAAGNRTKDNSIAYILPKALCNRMLHFECIIDVDGWKKWGIHSASIHPLVLSFIEFNASKIYSDGSIDDPEQKAYASPRTWEFVSNILKYFDEPEYHSDTVYHLISGAIGGGMGLEFVNFIRLNYKLPAIRDIFDGKSPERPKKQDQIYALISAMISYTIKHHTMKELKNASDYISGFPKDYQTLYFMSVISKSEEIRSVLLKIPYFYDFLQTNNIIAG